MDSRVEVWSRFAGAMQLIEPSSVDADLASWSFVRRSSSTLQLYQFVEVNFSSKTSAKPFCGIPIIQCKISIFHHEKIRWGKNFF